jgi:6-carboxyhexanoate--CoA ligase
LSAKVTSAPGIVAELCWSDDPAYTAGYVSAPGLGYRRISAMKAQGDPLGGRVFFVNPSKVQAEDFVSYLEKQPVLFEEMGMVCPAEAWSGDNA